MTTAALALTLALAAAWLLRRRRPRRGYVPTIRTLPALARLRNAQE